MTMNSGPSVHIDRRRFLTIAAAMTTASLLTRDAAALGYQTFTWRGVALGAPAMLMLQDRDEARAKDVIDACLAEVARLEAIFSLHRRDSALVRLNETGALPNAPADLRRLLAEALLIAERSGGAFDPTIQPLWQFHSAHTERQAALVNADELTRIRALVGWQKVRMDGTTVRFEQPGMALTLNGIAQGYITDKVGDILRTRGFEHVMVDMGEQLAVGPKWDGKAWHIGIRHPEIEGLVMETVAINSGAVATSSNGAGSGSAHILDPHTGNPAEQWSSVTVVAPSATQADGLSTALTLLPAERWPQLVPANVRVYGKNGSGAVWVPHRPSEAVDDVPPGQLARPFTPVL